MTRAMVKLCSAILLVIFVAGCSVGPKYQRPSAQTTPTYKESSAPAATPETTPPSSNQPSAQPNNAAAATRGNAQNNPAVGPSNEALVPPPVLQPSGTPPFRVAQPSDSLLRTNWWEMFNDSQLNDLEAQVNVSNQNIAAAAASYFSARALVREARSQFFPTAGTAPSAARERTTPNYLTFADYTLPFDATWVPDLWGRVRNTVAQYSTAAQVSAADLENTRLTVHAEVAVDYYSLRGEDALKQLLDSTVVAYQQSLDLTRALYDTGIDSDESVAQAETQLESVQAQDTGVGIARAQYEHAIAVLLGQPPSAFSIAPDVAIAVPPPIPVSAPSDLLERRPDIAAAERSMASANAQIGIAQSAFYPTVTLSATGGFSAESAAAWLTWPSRVWSIGAGLSETLFDAGLRRATVQQYIGLYNQDVANYRQTVLSAFQQVEDNLAASRILTLEIQQQNSAVQSAQRNLSLATDRYRLGIDPYLNVITAETTYLTNQQTAVSLHTQQMVSAVGLIEALGGGWSTAQLPSAQTVLQVSDASAPMPQTASGGSATR